MPLVPMEFHLPQSPISQPHGGDPLHFTPSSPSIQLAQRLKNSNACASRDDLDLRDRANDRELHSANLLPSRAEERTLYPLKLIDRTKKAPPRTPLASTTGCAPECPTEGPATSRKGPATCDFKRKSDSAAPEEPQPLLSGVPARRLPPAGPPTDPRLPLGRPRPAGRRWSGGPRRSLDARGEAIA